MGKTLVGCIKGFKIAADFLAISPFHDEKRPTFDLKILELPSYFLHAQRYRIGKPKALAIAMPAQTRIQTGPVPFQSSSSSPTSSLPEFDFEKRDDNSEKLSPLQSISPQSLHTKPWPERPQELHNGRHEEWSSWEPIFNCVMLMLPLPFFILIAAAIVVNGNAVTEQQSGLLDFAVKAVGKP